LGFIFAKAIHTHAHTAAIGPTEILLGSWVGNWCNELVLGMSGPSQWFQSGLFQGDIDAKPPLFLETV